MSARALGLLIGVVADRLLGDPRRFHPVAGFGTLAQRAEKLLYRDSRAAGLAHAGLLIGSTTAAGAVVWRVCRTSLGTAASTAVATWAVLGATSLEREAVAVHVALQTDGIDAARIQVSRLVGRRTDQLTPAEVARAAVESLAENTSDAVVAPLWWGAVAGVPGLLGYRAANTLDAMVGHHSVRYENFGWAAARFDDLINLAPARLTAVLTVLTAPPGSRRVAWRTWRRDGSRHPSPNAGQVEAAFAGALGIVLGGSNDYDGNLEHRPVLGDGRPVESDDIPSAAALARRVDLAAVLVSAALAAAIGRLSSKRRAVS